MKNLTFTPLTTDLSDYFKWLDVNYGIRRATNSSQTITAPPKKCKDKLKNHSWIFVFLIIDNSPCLSTPCLHNSTCVVESEHSFQCICSSAFIGVYCEIGKF